MPRNRAGLIIATYEGVQVDWPVIIADGLSATIDSIKGKDGKKMWTMAYFFSAAGTADTVEEAGETD